IAGMSEDAFPAVGEGRRGDAVNRVFGHPYLTVIPDRAEAAEGSRPDDRSFVDVGVVPHPHLVSDLAPGIEDTTRPQFHIAADVSRMNAAAGIAKPGSNQLDVASNSGGDPIAPVHTRILALA